MLCLSDQQLKSFGCKLNKNSKRDIYVNNTEQDFWSRSFLKLYFQFKNVVFIV